MQASLACGPVGSVAKDGEGGLLTQSPPRSPATSEKCSRALKEAARDIISASLFGPQVESDYRSSRREAIVAGIIFVVACVWVIGTCAVLGYGQPVHSIGGIPNWALWGIFLPWAACFVVNIWYSLIFIRDEDEPNEPPPAGKAE